MGVEFVCSIGVERLMEWLVCGADAGTIGGGDGWSPIAFVAAGLAAKVLILANKNLVQF